MSLTQAFFTWFFVPETKKQSTGRNRVLLDQGVMGRGVQSKALTIVGFVHVGTHLPRRKRRARGHSETLAGAGRKAENHGSCFAVGIPFTPA